jgi:hypothetical protein
MSSSPPISVEPERPNPKIIAKSTKVQQTDLKHVENKVRNRTINGINPR